ncbi:MAG: hypothetical protein MAG795_00283 [Candidatus Woesearchaeota archaeon]|nr:hypothetical protein [Candidatus Woesearchaeota archaeon]
MIIIAKKTKKKENKCNPNCCTTDFSSMCKGGAIYGMGFIGALVYFISTATSFWMGLLGILKALVWPAFVVHGLFKLFGL